MNNETQNLTIQDELAASTNLSLDQLKEEGGPHSPTTGGTEQTEAVNDLNEIRTGDDLNEPDAEALPEDGATGLTDDEPQPDGDSNEAANPAELNS